MKIGNIIYDGELVTHDMVDYINYIKKPIKFIDIANDLPTLYVGWSFMKETNTDCEIISNADILKKKIISGKLYWEFNFDEHKSSHVNGINRFVSKLPEIYFRFRYKYVDLDPIFFQITDTDELFDVLPKKIDLCYNYKDDILYVLSNDVIFGININTYTYFKFDESIIKKRINDRCDKYINDIDGDIYTKYNKKFPDFYMIRRYIPVILSK
ncbi:MAG: hypothetical protein ACOC3V_01375 [bacterium]